MRRNTATTRIEFAGLPGSGKSTILRAFSAEYGTELSIVPIYSDLSDDARAAAPLRVWRKGSAIVAFLLTRPVAAFRTAQFLKRASGLSAENLKHLLRCWSFAALAGRREGRGGLLLADQGFVQFMGSLAVPERGTELPDVEPALSSILLLDGLVHVLCPADVAQDRRATREGGQSRFEEAGPDRSNRNLERFSDALDASVDVVRTRGIPILTLDAADPVHLNIARLSAWIRSVSKASQDDPP